MIARDKLARELYDWCYEWPIWPMALDSIHKECFQEADRIIKLLKGVKK